MNAKTRLIAVASIIAVVITALVLILCIKGDGTTANAQVDIYFLNGDKTGIVAQQKIIKYRNENELIQNTLESLRKGPGSSKLGAVMQKDTQINSIRFTEKQFLTVDFSDRFLTDDPSRNVLHTYAVVKTLCSTPYVSSVKVLVDGVPIKDRDGNELDYISASDINLETEEFQSELRDVSLYFADETDKFLVKEMRRIKITDQQPIEQYIINELIKGTQEKKLKTVLSKNTVLMSVDVEDNICYLNFKSNFLTDNSGSDEHEKLVIYSIVNSLTDLNTIGRVQFYMDGKRVENFGKMDIKNYISRDTSIIKGEAQ